MKQIINRLRAEQEYEGLLAAIYEQQSAGNPHPLLMTGLAGSARNLLYAALAQDFSVRYGRGILLVVPDEKEALRVASTCGELGLRVFSYPFRDLIFHPITASHEYEQERLAVLSAVLRGDFDIVVTTPDALLQFTIPPRILSESGRKLAVGACVPLEEMIAYLERCGYVRCDLVDGCGQYSLRGGILDIFPPHCEYPLRLQYFGDEIENMEYFDILSQRRLQNIETAELTPAREILLDAGDRLTLRAAIAAQRRKVTEERTREILDAEIEAIDAGSELNFLDKYLSLIYPDHACLLDYFAEHPLMVLQDHNALKERLRAYEFHQKENVEALLKEGALAAKYASFGYWPGDFEEASDRLPSVFCETFTTGLTGRKLSGYFSFVSKQTVSYADQYDLLLEDLGFYLRSGYTTALLCENEAMAKNLQELLEGQDIPSVLVRDDEMLLRRGLPAIFWGVRLAGFELTSGRFALLSAYASTAGAVRPRSASPRKRNSVKGGARERIMSYADLTVGDYVVHAMHGIGQYLGLENIMHEGVTREFVKIRYDGSDMLYLPTDQLDMVSKYIGARGPDDAVKLSKMGGVEWKKAKQRAKRAVKEMAKELIALYAARKRQPGFGFSADDDFQREFEEAFAYEETEGQLRAVEEIKQDMQLPHPMDRLLCGDVGFGKTEVALRAAFKAVECGKQVAILVPTTILALQHYQTVTARMRGFPIQADMVSRFRTTKQIAETLRRVRRGEVDILIGTHRILSKDVEFKDLGLLIVDEEQRFGVAQKEKIKQKFSSVDVLTLTATPIPRTLNMAMSGIRDMSILEEAPGDRLPVQSYVLEYDEGILADALRKELHRGGQVFWLHNRIDNIEQKAAAVQAMAPEARVAFAHGQMEREQISDIWRSLVEGETDILVCTSIIETGVDVPNANTLIIEHADALGLSQLHQLRGRIGRSSRRAYAYFTYPRGAALSEISEKRLEAIRDYAEFGSGFKVALRDLEIRGAGNLLGSEQHGHIDSVGYDLYMKLLDEAILEERGETVKPQRECIVELAVDAYIPESYMKSSAQRMDAYKKIASIETDEDVKDITDELFDRYGKLPRAVSDLVAISQIRVLGRRCGLTKIESKPGCVLCWPARVDAVIWAKLAALCRGRVLMNFSSMPYMSCRVRRGEDMLQFLRGMLGQYLLLEEAAEKEKMGNL